MAMPAYPRLKRPVTSFVFISSVPRPLMPDSTQTVSTSLKIERTVRGHCKGCW